MSYKDCELEEHCSFSNLYCNKNSVSECAYADMMFSVADKSYKAGLEQGAQLERDKIKKALGPDIDSLIEMCEFHIKACDRPSAKNSIELFRIVKVISITGVDDV